MLKCSYEIMRHKPILLKDKQALCVIFKILASLENVKKMWSGGCTITSRLKSTLFDIFGHPPFEKMSNNVDFSL